MKKRLSERKPKFLLLRRAVAAYIDMGIPIALILALGFGVYRLFPDFDKVTFIMLILPLAFAAIFCKDLLRPSIGKRIMGLDIVSKDSGEISNWLLVRRNFSMCLWPLEIPELIRSGGSRRLTDRELGHEIIER